ncbi:transferase [Xylaria nigripes]|nr:transferase [Xylaria nigripes]
MEAASGPRIRSVKRIFPTYRLQNVTVTRLSILDAIAAGLPDSGAIWFYNKADGIDANDPIFVEHLEFALSAALNECPHYAGQLQWATAEDVKGSSNPRHLGRPITTYGSPNDPGVELVIAEESKELSAIIPSFAERFEFERIWNASKIRQNDFLAGTPLAFSTSAKCEGRPGVAAQLTAFKCGGFAVSLRTAHCLADATSLMQFVRLWAKQFRILCDFGHTEKFPTDSPRLRSLFDPTRLDRQAKLDPSESEPDAERLCRARSLPMHRFHWWPTKARELSSCVRALNPPLLPLEVGLSSVQLSPSTDPPWLAWDLNVPVENVQIHFRKDEVARMKNAATSSLSDDLKVKVKVSRQDALLSHLWILINRARRMENFHGQVYMNIALGLRSRVSQPLPDNFMGSPMLIAYVTKSGNDLVTATIGDIAGSIRETISRFTPLAISDHLYDAAHEASPQRIRQMFFGSRHVTVTSWVRAQAYEVDFCGTGQVRYVQSQMPPVDGILQLTDIGGTGDFDVSLCLSKDAMERLLSDSMLRAYDE